MNDTTDFKKMAYDLEGVLQDVDGMDDLFLDETCIKTLKRTRDKLFEFDAEIVKINKPFIR